LRIFECGALCSCFRPGAAQRGGGGGGGFFCFGGGGGGHTWGYQEGQMGSKLVRFGALRGTRSRQDEPMEVHRWAGGGGMGYSAGGGSQPPFSAKAAIWGFFFRYFFNQANAHLFPLGFLR
jgi:hypothetical protein